MKTTRRPAVLFREEFREPLKFLSCEEKGRLLDALLSYAFDEEKTPELPPGNAFMAFQFIRARLDADALNYREACERNSENGKLGGRPSKKPTAFSETDRFPENRAVLKKPKKANVINVREGNKDNIITEPSAPKISPSFEAFWGEYPRKQGKGAAIKAWRRGKLDALKDVIVADIKNRVANDQQWKDPQYIPHAATYLNGRRWEDEPLLTTSSDNSNLLPLGV